MLVDELKEIHTFSKRHYSELVVLGFATLFVTLNEHHSIGSQWSSALLYYALLPVLVIIVFLRRNPLDFGLRLGNYRIWGFHVAVACLVGLPILYIASRSSLLQGYYTIEQFSPLKFFLETVAMLFAWEFLFRGFLLFGLKDKLGEISIVVQMVPFVILHFGKPEIETLSTILLGLYLGYVAYRGNSYWPALIFHLVINISFICFVNLC